MHLSTSNAGQIYISFRYGAVAFYANLNYANLKQYDIKHNIKIIGEYK
jgi:hypothetical protein